MPFTICLLPFASYLRLAFSLSLDLATFPSFESLNFSSWKLEWGFEGEDSACLRFGLGLGRGRGGGDVEAMVMVMVMVEAKGGI